MFDANPDAASSHTPVEPGIKSLQSKLDDIKRSKKGTKHKDGRPLRPLSAYNIFFQLERKRILREQADPNAKHATGGFGSLASTISAKWKQVDTAVRMELNAMAQLDKERYDRENEEWKLGMMMKAEEEQTDAAKVVIDAKPSEGVTLDSDIDSKAEVSSIVKPSPLASAGRRRHTITGGIVPPLPFQTAQVLGRHPCFPIPLGDDASYMPFSQQPEPSQQIGGVFQFSNNRMQGMDSNLDNDVAYRITPDQHPKQSLELLQPQVEAFDFSSESFTCAPCFSTTAGRRVSCGDIDSYNNASSTQGMPDHGGSQNDNFVMPNGNTSFNGCIDAAGFQNDNFVFPNGNASSDGCIDASGYQNENFAMPNGNKEGPEYMRGYMQGFKVACEMWDKIGV